ncbi:MAG: trypsin-like peptidase domain-containing protein [Chloroflexota bacterium]
MNQELYQLNESMTALAEEAKRSLVQVKNGEQSGGAGVVWDEHGHIVTNAHVIHSNHPQVITLDKQEFEASIIGLNREKDIALLQIPHLGLPPIAKGDSKALRAGDYVMSSGHPWGVIGALTAGGVIGVGVPTSIQGYEGELIQVGMVLRPGHSGGPMVDSEGKLVGLNAMISGPRAGLAVPIHEIEKFIKRLLTVDSEYI